MAERRTMVGEHTIAIWTEATAQAGIDRFNEIVQSDTELHRLLDEMATIQAKRGVFGTKDFDMSRNTIKQVMALSNRIEKIKDAAEKKAFGKIQI